MCGRVVLKKEEKKVKRRKRVATLEEEIIVRWTIDDKENWERKEEIKENYKKIEELVPRKFLKCVMALTMTLNLAEYYLILVSIPEVYIDLVSTS